MAKMAFTLTAISRVLARTFLPYAPSAKAVRKTGISPLLVMTATVAVTCSSGCWRSMSMRMSSVSYSHLPFSVSSSNMVAKGVGVEEGVMVGVGVTDALGVVAGVGEGVGVGVTTGVAVGAMTTTLSISIKLSPKVQKAATNPAHRQTVTICRQLGRLLGRLSLPSGVKRVSSIAGISLPKFFFCYP